MTDIDIIAKEIATSVPVGQLTVESFIPVIGYLCSHLSEIESLDGSQKKQVVIRCLDIAVDQMGFPQKAILRPMVDTVAPPAIDALIKAAKTVQIDVAHVFSVSRATVLVPQTNVDKDNSTSKSNIPTRNLLGGGIFHRSQPFKTKQNEVDRSNRWRLPAMRVCSSDTLRQKVRPPRLPLKQVGALETRLCLLS